MAEPREIDDMLFREVEDLVRAAGGYLDVSDDLRPRTLESARAASRERKMRRVASLGAVAVVLLALATTAVRRFGEDQHAANPREAPTIVRNSQDFFLLADAKAAASDGNVSWGMVEALREVRARQSKLIRRMF
jgi:hypothetical protein